MSAFDEIKNLTDTTGTFTEMTIGRVVDTNDPQQMGRIRIACPYLGDDDSTVIEDIPWATPISQFGGINESAARGRVNDRTPGPVAYGFFNIPKVGSSAVVTCIEGDPKFRIYIGSINPQFLTHTMPHGRYLYDNFPASDNNSPHGPLSSTDDPIQPLFDSQTSSFTKDFSKTGQAINEPRKNFEFRTRGADTGVSGINAEYVQSEDNIYISQPDDNDQTFTEPDGNVVENTQGYHTSRVQEGLRSSATGEVYDPQVYSWTTPGFHGISMSDNSDNCRVRFRSTHGHQIILDDTNERIYVSTAAGKTWIELDEKGNIDIYGERNISIHAEQDLNLTAGDTVRVTAKNGIHLVSEDEIRMHAQTGNLHIKSGDSIEVNAQNNINLSATQLSALIGADIFLTAGGSTHILSTADIFLTAGGSTHISSTVDIFLTAGGAAHILSSSVLNLESGGGVNILAGGEIIQTGSSIHLNGPPAAASAASASATPADAGIPTSTFDAWWTNRIPEHEPWARVMTLPSVTDTDMGNSHNMASEFQYNDANVGRIERGFDLTRNINWHR